MSLKGKMISGFRQIAVAVRKPVYVQVSDIHYGGELLKGKNILITGGSDGIGLATAKACVREGAEVIITGRTESKLISAAETIGASRCRYLVWDISDYASVQPSVGKIKEMTGNSLHAVVFSAGIFIGKNFVDCTPAEWEKTISTNIGGIYFATAPLAGVLEQSGGGSIVMINSIRGILHDSTPYSTSKTALVGLTKALAKELHGAHIRVNSIAPSPTASGINGLESDGDLMWNITGGRMLRPEEVVQPVLFLLSDASKCITGQIIACDNGASLS